MPALWSMQPDRQNSAGPILPVDQSPVLLDTSWALMFAASRWRWVAVAVSSRLSATAASSLSALAWDARSLLWTAMRNASSRASCASDNRSRRSRHRPCSTRAMQARR